MPNIFIPIGRKWVKNNCCRKSSARLHFSSVASTRRRRPCWHRSGTGTVQTRQRRTFSAGKGPASSPSRRSGHSRAAAGIGSGRTAGDRSVSRWPDDDGGRGRTKRQDEAFDDSAPAIKVGVAGVLEALARAVFPGGVVVVATAGGRFFCAGRGEIETV